MTAVLDHPDVDEQIDLTELISWDEEVVCTSRTDHLCTIQATHRTTSTLPCPDPIKGVFWCFARYRMHMALIRGPYNCRFCSRDISVCWRVHPV